MVRYPGLTRFNYLQSGKYLLVCILGRNPVGGGGRKTPTYHKILYGVVPCMVVPYGLYSVLGAFERGAPAERG